MSERLAWLRRFMRLVVEREGELCRAIGADVGKPEWQALTGDVMTLLASCKWHLKHAKGLLRERRVGRAWTFLPGTSAAVRRQPVGTVAIIATWNYPVQLLGIQLVQALVAGNRVVVKPCERSASSQRLLLELARQAGAGADVLIWTEATREAGPALLAAHAAGAMRLDHVVFTGSTAVGQMIAKWGAEHLVPTTLELSGNDSAVVLADSDIALAARSILEAVAMNSGQTCLAPRRVLVHRAAHDAFVREAERVLGVINGRGGLKTIDAAALERCDAMAAEAVGAGGRIVGAAGGLRLVVDCPERVEMVTCATREHFGPLVGVMAFDDEAHAVRIHSSCRQHLMTSVFTRDATRASGLIDALAAAGAGVVSVNDCVLPGGHPGIGITGSQRSGWGTSRGAEGLMGLTRPVYVTRTGWPRLPLGPLPEAMLARMRSGLKWMFR